MPTSSSSVVKLTPPIPTMEVIAVMAGGAVAMAKDATVAVATLRPCDVTDPNVGLSHVEYQALTPKQHPKRYERKQARNGLPAQPPSSATCSVSQMGVTPASVAILPDAPSVASAAMGATGTITPGTMLRHMMSTSAACGPTAAPTPAPASSDDTNTVNGVQFRRCNTLSIRYCINDVNVLLHRGSLIDGGANGGVISANNALVLEKTFSRLLMLLESRTLSWNPCQLFKLLPRLRH